MNMVRKMQRFFSKWQMVTKIGSEDRDGETQTKLLLIKRLIGERSKLHKLMAFRRWKELC
jgi:hypothetical protein